MRTTPPPTNTYFIVENYALGAQGREGEENHTWYKFARLVVFCRYLQNRTRGVYPGYYPTKNMWEFCTTLIPVPGTSVSSVRPFHKYQGYGYSIFIPAWNL